MAHPIQDTDTIYIPKNQPAIGPINDSLVYIPITIFDNIAVIQAYSLIKDDEEIKEEVVCDINHIKDLFYCFDTFTFSELIASHK